MKCQHPAFAAMLRAADGFLTSFRRDLEEHDRNALERADPKRAFLWALRPSSTHICFTDGLVDGVGHSPADYVHGVEEAWRGADGEIRWFYWDGDALRPVSSEDACRLAADDLSRVRMPYEELLSLAHALASSPARDAAQRELVRRRLSSDN